MSNSLAYQARSLLDQESSFLSKGEWSTLESLLSAAAKIHPEFCVMQLTAASAESLAFLAQFQVRAPRTQAILLLGTGLESQIRSLARHSVAALMLESEVPEMLRAALSTLVPGACWLSPACAVQALGRSRRDSNWNTLTRREKQILLAIAQGNDNHSIATQLTLAEQTVRNYASAIYEKLGVSSRAEAVCWAHEQGLL